MEALVFSYEFCEVFKNTFTLEHLWYMLLDFPKALTENPEKVKRTSRGLLSLTYSESRLLSLRKKEIFYVLHAVSLNIRPVY